MKLRFFISASIMMAGLILIDSCGDNSDDSPSAPVISAFSPTHGSEGTTVVITGNNFSTMPSENIVSFNGTEATVESATKTQLVTMLPAGAVTGKVAITVNGLKVISLVDFVVEGAPIVSDSLTIVSFAPTGGVAGEAVTITGTGFSLNTADNFVRFGGEIAVVTSAAATSLKVQVPKGASTGKITVQVGARTASTSDDFVIVGSQPPLIVSTLAGNGTIGDVDGNGGNASFQYLSAVTADESGNVYVIEGFHSSIRKISSNGTVTSMAAGLELPVAIALDHKGNIYVSDSSDNSIRKIDSDGVVSTLAGGSNQCFSNIAGIAVDTSGNIYVADQFNHSIRKVTPEGEVSTIAGNRASPGFADGATTVAKFLYPSKIAVDHAGNLYVVDANGYGIRKITPNGFVSTLSPRVTGSGQIMDIWGVAVDKSRYIYVADGSNNKIYKITPDGIVSAMAGDGTTGFADGYAPEAKFDGPTDVAVDHFGNVYIADYNNHRIRKIR